MVSNHISAFSSPPSPSSSFSSKIPAAFKPGSIRKITLQNFLTYTSVTFSPGSRLNIVIGPNGSGKSAILCAICLGLGGAPNLLGRADDVKAFIMHDMDKAVIEIELEPLEKSSGEKGTKHTIKRILEKGDDTSETGRTKKGGNGSSLWFINNKTSTLKAVKELVQKYKITVDNLCAFLPQDKVGDFSSFNKKELMLETEKSINTTQLYDVHMSLINMEKEARNNNQAVQTATDLLNGLLLQQAKVKETKDKMEERKGFVAKKKLLELKKFWLYFDNERVNAVQLKNERKASKRSMDLALLSIAPLASRKEELALMSKKQLAKDKKFAMELTKYQEDINNGDHKLQAYSDTIEAITSAVLTIEVEQKTVEKKADNQANIVNKFEKELAKMGDLEKLQKESTSQLAAYRASSQSATNAKKAYNEVQVEYNESNKEYQSAKKSLQSMQNAKYQKMQSLFKARQHGPNMEKICNWLDNHRDKFRYPVFGPIAAEIECSDPTIVRYIDMHIDNAVLTSFVVQSKDDSDYMYNEIRVKMKIPINIDIIIDADKFVPPNREYSRDRMETYKKKFGVRGFLDEFFSCPKAVLQDLIGRNSVNKVLVGDKTTQRAIDDNSLSPSLMDQLSTREPAEQHRGLMTACLLFPSAIDVDVHFKYLSSISRYNKREANLNVESFSGNPFLMSVGIDAGKMQEKEEKVRSLQDQLGRKSAAVSSKESYAKEMENEHREKNKHLTEAKNKITLLKNQKAKIDHAVTKLEELRAEAATDFVKEKESKCKQLRKAINSEIVELGASMVVYSNLMSKTYALAGIKMATADIEGEFRKVADLLVEKEAKSVSFKNDFERKKLAFQKSREQVKVLKERAEDKAPLADADGNELPLKVQLQDLPGSLDEVNAEIDVLINHISTIVDDSQVMKIYADNEIEIERLQNKQANSADAQQAMKSTMDSVAKSWEAKITNHLITVDKRFSEYMALLKCAGEVALFKGETYAEYGIELRVKFRESNKLAVLSHQTNSGGERSVATIMFLMALQDMMISPFRCVDEINQGMDEVFERQVFKRIVMSATDDPKDEGDPTSHSGQYFLITPKLLPNLTDMERDDVTICFIFNGPYSFKANEFWNNDAILENSKRKSIRGGGGGEGKIQRLDDEGEVEEGKE